MPARPKNVSGCAPRGVQHLMKVVLCRDRVPVRPQKLHYLLAVQPVPGRQREVREWWS